MKEINEHWEYSSLYDSEIIPKTFGRYKEYISNVFAIDIEYDIHSKRYYIENLPISRVMPSIVTCFLPFIFKD